MGDVTAIELLLHLIGWATDRMTYKRRMAAHIRALQRFSLEVQVSAQMALSIAAVVGPAADLEFRLRRQRYDELKAKLAELEARAPRKRPLWPNRDGLRPM